MDRRRGSAAISPSKDQRGDIYNDAVDTTAAQAWLDPVKAQEWVLTQLKAQGITMRAANMEDDHGSPA